MNLNNKPAAPTQLFRKLLSFWRGCAIVRLRARLLFVAAMLATCLHSSDAHAGPSTGPEVPPWKFMVIGDSRGSSESYPINTNIMSELAHEILRNHPDFVLFSGDLVYSGNKADFQTWHDLLSEVYAAGIGVYPVMGNHDDPDPDGFISVFGADIPDNGPPAEINRTYFLVHSNALVLALDNYATPDVVNMAWVNSVLATNTLPHVFAMGHMPAFKVAHADCLDNYPQVRDNLWNSLKAAGARAYFAGHDHFYDHMRVDDGDGNESNDLHQIIVGTAGAPIYGDMAYDGNNTSWLPTRVFHEANYGYVLVEVNGTDASLTWHHRAGAGVYSPEDSWSYTAVTPACAIALSANSAGFGASGGAGSFVVSTGGGCAWSATPSVAWLHTTSGTKGSGTVNYTVDANSSTSTRVGTIAVGDQVFTVSQAAAVCDFTLSAPSRSFGTNGGLGTVTVKSQCGGSWTATNNGISWISILSGSSGNSTPGTVQYFVDTNFTGKARTGYITVAGQRYGVFQGPLKNRGDLDFDGDGKADITIYDPVPGDWYVAFSGGGSTAFRWGGGSMVPVHGDFDGDGRSDRAAYYPDTGEWFLSFSRGGMNGVRWGYSAAAPMPADYDGDGKTDCGVWDTNTGDWYISYSSGGSTAIHWGWRGVKALTGDFDGDGKADLVAYDPAPGDWYLRYANGKMTKFNWGGGTMVPLVGDFNGDGKADAVAYYAAVGVFYIRFSGGGMTSIQWAGGTMKPVLADFDGDGRTDIAAYDAPGGAWYIRYATGAMTMVRWGWSQALAP